MGFVSTSSVTCMPWGSNSVPGSLLNVQRVFALERHADDDVGVVVDGAVIAKALRIDGAASSGTVAAVFCSCGWFAADEEVVGDHGMIKRLARVNAETVADFHDGVVLNDIALAEAADF